MTSFYEFQQQFPDDDACLHRIMTARYGGTRLECPKCQRMSKFHRMKNQLNYVCQYCGHHIYPCVGTPMERSHTPLHKWFYAMFLFSTSRHGVAARELQRQLKVTYKTAWRMAHKIREHMANVDGEYTLDGVIEADETYVGGQTSGGKRGRGAPNKTVVFGMLERNGDIMTKVVPNVQKRTLYPIIAENVAKGSTVHTDALRSYTGLSSAGYRHETVNHGREEYVNGSCHVNGLEGFWARLKLSIHGTHVHVSGKYLQYYAKEFEYRYNRRQRPSAMFDDLVANL